ncbi:phosphoglycerate dehydrogenase [Miltoncostaea marina]|uniref:phosphoglycerate dehydrogenase n=1 Tax=Miltoncostaea marina TaxID=2843215 RepID=UPI001C3DCF76|nr:phosphoglycerate dehydrogenase [Miltoncostaea marina]
MGTLARADLRVLVCERIADAGVEHLSNLFSVDLGLDWSKEELEERIGAYDAIVVRSATKVTGDLIARAERLKVVGRAGTGVDNVDVPAATRRGIVVCNAAGSNALSAAEHAIALMLAQARNIPQAHSSLVAGRWERSRFGGIEVTGKTLGVLGFGRIGQMVAERAKGLGMHVVAYDPLVAEGRYRELGVDKADTPADLYAVADFVTLHLASTPETRGFVDAAAFAAMKPGARLINAARGDVVDQDALVEALRSGHLGGAGIDVFPKEPTVESPLFGLPGVVVTPHLGASTEEAQDRAGIVVAEQVAAALTGGVVTSAVNIPAVGPEALEVLGPFLPLAKLLGQLLAVLVGGPAPVEISYEGQLASLDTRLLTSAVLEGVLHGRIEEPVNVVNATSLAEERGIEWSEITIPRARDYTNRLSLRAGDVAISGTTVGTAARPRLVEAFGQDIDIELAPHIGLFRYLDIPGQIGRVGTILGLAHVNIASMAVSRSRAEGLAVMAVTVDSPVPPETVRAIQHVEGFDRVWFAALEVDSA